MPESVVPLGSVVFALIDPSPGSEAAFNHWYERDHYYTAGVAAPGVFSAGHFIVEVTHQVMNIALLPNFGSMKNNSRTEFP